MDMIYRRYWTSVVRVLVVSTETLFDMVCILAVVSRCSQLNCYFHNRLWGSSSVVTDKGVTFNQVNVKQL